VSFLQLGTCAEAVTRIRGRDSFRGRRNLLAPLVWAHDHTKMAELWSVSLGGGRVGIPAPTPCLPRAYQYRIYLYVLSRILSDSDRDPCEARARHQHG